MHTGSLLVSYLTSGFHVAKHLREHSSSFADFQESTAEWLPVIIIEKLSISSNAFIGNDINFN